MRIVKKYLNSGLFDLIPTNVFPNDETQEVGYTLDSLGLPVPTYMLPITLVYNYLYSTPSGTMRTDNIGILQGDYYTMPLLDDGTTRSQLVQWLYDNVPISAEDVAYSIPYVGDALDAGVSLLNLDLGNYGLAALGLGLLALPNFIEKPLKRIWKYGRSLYNKSKGIRFNVAANGRTNLIFDHEGITWRLVPDGTGIPYALLLKDFLGQEYLDEALEGIFDPDSKVLKHEIVQPPKEGEPLPLYDILNNYTDLKAPGDALGIGVGGRLSYAYASSPERLKAVQALMGWDDKALAEYVEELRRNFGESFNVIATNFEPGKIGEHEIWFNPTTNEVKHTTYYNQNEQLTALQALELGLHEIGAHGGTFSLNPSAILYPGSTEAVKRKAFPRTYELMKKNADIAHQVLKLNKMGNFISLFKSKADLAFSQVYKLSSPELKDYLMRLYDDFHYISKDLETYARGFTGKVFDKYFPGTRTDNMAELERYYTPESTENYKKAIVGLAPWIFGGGIGYNYLNQDNTSFKHNNEGKH